jgi:hypothetical protein
VMVDEADTLSTGEPMKEDPPAAGGAAPASVPTAPPPAAGGGGGDHDKEFWRKKWTQWRELFRARRANSG